MSRAPQQESDNILTRGDGSARGRAWGMIMIMLVAAALRLAYLGRASYTIDESELIKIALSHESISELFMSEWKRFAFLHRLPVPMVLLRVSAMFGKTAQQPVPPEWLMRLPMAILGILTVMTMFGWGLIFRDRRIGWWAAFLSAISFFGVFYSREAYDYSLLIFLANSTLIAAAWFCREVLDSDSFPARAAVVYAAVASLLLQSHLSALLFLTPLSAAMVLIVARARGVAYFFRGGNPGKWLAVLAWPYLLFSPFLFKLAGGFVVTESDIARRFSAAVFPALWGRMGWGEAWVPLTLFVAFWGLGCFSVFRRRDGALRGVGILALAGMTAYFVLQSWMLRVSRFEIRYYSALFPALLLFAALGLVFAEDALSRKAGASRAARLRNVAALVLAVWSLPSLWWILRLECRGFANFKAIARWVNEHVPESGVYAFLNVYDLRGVPQTYPTPGRVGTCVTYWSSKEEHVRTQPVERMRQFFTEFPTAYFVEIAPRDLLAAGVAEDFIPRQEFFLRSVWLHDPAFERLVQWKTLPLGDTQPNATNEHRVLISYNLPEDLPSWARKTGRSVYRYYGPGWTYVRDRDARDWMAVTETGVLRVGNPGNEPRTVRLSAWAVAVPDRARITIRAGGQTSGESKEVPPYPARLTLADFVVPPGEQEIEIEVLGTDRAHDKYVALHQVELRPL